MRYKTITIRIEISGEEESVLKAATDIEISLSRKILRRLWFRRVFMRDKNFNLDSININQFPKN